jgi:hypothetical protein
MLDVAETDLSTITALRLEIGGSCLVPVIVASTSL